MKAVKIDIVTALKASAALVSLCSTRIYSGWPPSVATYPCVGFYRIAGQKGTADGKLSARTNELYPVDCFALTRLETESMEAAIDAALSGLNWIVTAEHGPDLYEPDTKLFHKVLRYRIKS